MTKQYPYRYLTLEDDTVWPRPGLDSDYYSGVGWELTYAPDQMTRQDQIHAASIISAYATLVTEPSMAKKLPMVRRALRDHLDQYPQGPIPDTSQENLRVT